MGLLREYYDALERVVSTHEATLMSFSGDGAMVLVNAPVSCSDPALRAVNMARDMQMSVQKLLVNWRALDNRLGFGVGLAMGPATVGRIGSEGRLHYNAIGNVCQPRIALMFECRKFSNPDRSGRSSRGRSADASGRAGCADIEGF